MAVRDGMAYIIAELRGLTDTAKDSYLVDEVAYWSDQQLQDILDQYRYDAIDVQLLPVQLYNAGTTEYKRYYIPASVEGFMETTDTVGAFEIVDSTGNAAPSYTFNFLTRVIEFDDDTGGTEYFLRARVYDVKQAASKVWGMKASHRTELIDWKGGGYTLAEDQEYQHCLEMQRFYGGNTIGVTRLVRRGYGAWGY